MAGQPGGDLLVPDDLGILMPGVTQRHDEKPGRSDLAGVEIDQFGTGAEVDLCGLARCKIKDDRGFGLIIGQGLHKPPHRRVTAGEAVVAHQGAVDGCAVDPFAHPGLDLRSIGSHRGAAARLLRPLGKRPGKLRLAGQRTGRIKPTLCNGFFADLAGFTPPDDTCPGKIAV